MKRLATVVLAAGGSRRLGQPKQLLSVDGVPMVVRMVIEARAAALGPVAAVVGSDRDRIVAALGGLDVAILSNESWASGMATSIHVATHWARALDAAGLLLVLCDQPALRASHLRSLGRLFQEGHARVGSAYGGTVGVPAIFSSQSFDALLKLEGDRGAHAVLRAAKLASVPWPEGLSDVDTPADAARWSLC